MNVNVNAWTCVDIIVVVNITKIDNNLVFIDLNNKTKDYAIVTSMLEISLILFN